MIYLRPVTQDNYNECLELKREQTDYVGDAYAVLADAYIYRKTSLAYAIYYDDVVIGLVILDEKGKNQSYEFTDLFIADDYRNKGYGEHIVKEIINHFVRKDAKSIHMQVHKSNKIAMHIYQKCGFSIKETSPWDNDFLIMEIILKGRIVRSSMDYTIRELQKQEYPLLDNFLYEAIFIPEGIAPPPKTIITAPELQIYIKRFGELKDDRGLVAEVDGKIVGAVWVRIMDDYGHIDNETPSLAISLYKEYRGFGIGTAMMKKMLALLKSHGYKQVSLSVQKANYAAKLYLKVGFEIVKENEEDYIMICHL